MNYFFDLTKENPGKPSTALPGLSLSFRFICRYFEGVKKFQRQN
jgi:hypothetical protein